MKKIFFTITISLICLLHLFTFPEQGQSLTFDSLPSAEFRPVILNETVQLIEGGMGNIVVSSILLDGDWEVYVHATQFTSNNGPPLPLRSLQLKPPIKGPGFLCNKGDVLITNYSAIDTEVGSSLHVLSGNCGLLGLLGNCSFIYPDGTYPFRLKIDPNLKVINSGRTSTYSSKITWTISSTP